MKTGRSVRPESNRQKFLPYKLREKLLSLRSLISNFQNDAKQVTNGIPYHDQTIAQKAYLIEKILSQNRQVKD